MNADRRVEVFAVAGAFTRVIADAAVHGRHRIVANEHLPGVAILPSLRQGKPGLDVLAGRTRVIAGRQQVDVNRAPGSNRACPLLPGQIHDWRHVVWFVPHVRLLRASALVRLAAARQGRYDVVAAEDLIWVNADHFRFAPGSGSHGTGSSNPVPSSRESRANLTSSIRAPKLRSATACSLASLRRSVRHADFAGAKRSSNSLGRGFCARSPLKILSRPVHSSGDQITERREGKELHTAGRQRPRDPQTAPYRMAPHSPMMGLRRKRNSLCEVAHTAFR